MNTVAGIAVLILSCIGNAELWVILVNRRHSLRYRHATLRQIRSLHDFGLLLFPPFILCLAGLTDGGLLRGGTFSDQRLSVQWILIITMTGVIPFAYSVIRWQVRSAPTRLLSTSSKVHDALRSANTAKERAAVTGERISTISSFPFNQIFQLEVNRKRIRIGRSPGNPSVRRLLTLAHFSDVHLIGCPGKGFHDFVTDRLAELQPDAFVFTGDLLDRIVLLDWAVESFRKLASVAPGYFILGNHDWHLEHQEIRAAICDTGWQNVADRHSLISLAGASVRIAGTEAPWLGENPAVPQREEANEDVRILLSHSPDQRDYACSNDFDLMLSGHNHGGQVVLPFFGPVYSPSKYGVKYSGGVFEHNEMVIHVSRGVAAKDPLRWNCRPEVTLLELEF